MILDPRPSAVAASVSLAEVVTARGGRRLSEEEGWALLCASVQVYSSLYGSGSETLPAIMYFCSVGPLIQSGNMESCLAA
jgi:hypothetical protein